MKEILVPTDFSPAASNALEYAARLAQRIHGSITLLHVQPLFATDWFTAGVGMPNDMASRTNAVEERMKAECHLVEETFQVPCTSDVLISASELDVALGDLLVDRAFDLVVMGTNGTDDLFQFVFGSNTWHVFNKASCPVWIVPQDCAFETPADTVFATAFAEEEIKSLEHFMELIAPLHTKLSTLHITDDDPGEPDGMLFQELLTATFGTDHGFNHYDETAENTAEGIDDWVHQHGSDLLVMVRPHRSFIEELFHRSVTKQLSAISDIPMVVLH